MGMFNKKVATCTAAVPHTFSEDGFLRFGDSVVIAHKETGGSLACDPFDAAGFESNEYSSSVCESTTSMARNTFVIMKAEETDSEFVTWGTPFRLMANPSLRLDDKTNMLLEPLYLASALKNERKASMLSNNQLVYVTPKATYNTCWIANMPAVSKDSGAARMLSSGSPVEVGCDIVLQHCGTKQLLSSDSSLSLNTDFGTEYEVCGKTNVTTARISVMAGEFSGKRTPQTNCKPEMNQNIWSFVTSADPSAAADERNLPPPLSASGLVSSLVSAIAASNPSFAIPVLKSAVSSVAGASDGKLDTEDLKWCLRDLGVEFSDAQYGVLFAAFDKSGDGIVDISEFLSAVMGEMGEVSERSSACCKERAT